MQKLSSEKTEQLKQIIEMLKRDDINGWFLNPVDPKVEGCAEYYKVIYYPISFSEIHSRLIENHFTSENQIINELLLVFSNARLFNTKESGVVSMANNLEAGLLQMYREALKKPFSELKTPNPCVICSYVGPTQDENYTLRMKIAEIIQTSKTIVSERILNYIFYNYPKALKNKENGNWRIKMIKFNITELRNIFDVCQEVFKNEIYYRRSKQFV